MHTPIHPLLLAERGVHEDNCYAITGGFALKAINRHGQCIDFDIVHTRAEYEAALQRLTDRLEEADPDVTSPVVTRQLVLDAMRRRTASADLMPGAHRGAGLRRVR